MKTHHTSLNILLIISLFIFTFKNVAKAAPGDSCTSAISLSPGTSVNDYAFHSPDTAVWLSFIADSANMVIALTPPVLPADTPAEYVHTLSLYSGTCGGLTLITSSTITFGDTISPEIYKTGLTPGTKYYISVSKYNTLGCRICNTYPSYFGILVNGLFSTTMSTATCLTNPCGYNLVCNGDFTDAPSTAPNYYNMTLATPPCSATSNLNFVSGYGLANSYAIAKISATPSVYAVPVGPPPLLQAYSFCGNSPNTNFSSTCYEIAWEQTVPVIPNTQYQWSMWFKDLDLPNNPDGGGNDLPPATLSMVVAGLPNVTLFTDAINNTNYNNWEEVCENWTSGASQTSATLYVYDDCGGLPSQAGYDFMFNDISFAMVAQPTFTATASPSTVCTHGSSTLTIAPSIAGATYTWSPSSSLSSSTGTSVIATPTVTTTYTVSVTNFSNCGPASTTVTVNVDNFKVIQPVGSFSVCPGSCTTLSASALGGTSPYTYSWSPGTWLTSTTTSDPEVCPPSNATPGTYTYTVGVADAHGCNGVATFSVVVLPAPPVPAISGVYYACGSPPYTYTVTNPAVGANYVWTVSGGTNNTVSPTSGTTTYANLTTLPATITCTATYTGTGEDCSSIGTFTVYPCCATGPFAQIITNEDALTAGTSFTNESILINGTFTVDANTSFVGCDVQFTPNSSIIIENGSSLTIESSLSECSHLHAGCDAMWSGIFINSGGSLIADGSLNEGGGVLIEDAESAVAVNPSASPGTYSLNEVIFNKDYQGIVIDPTGAIYSGSATNCIFTCRNLSSIACPNWYADWQTGSATTISLTPYSGDITYSGIYMNTVHEYSNFTKCYFDNLEYGVYTTRSSVGVYGNTFQNIATPNGSYTGVYALNCWDCFYSISKYSVTVGGSVAWQWNTFTNCNIGVHAAYMDYITVDNNTFDNTGYAPFEYAVDEGERRLFGSGAGTISIRSNTINNAIVGIRALSNLNIQAAIDCNIISDPSCTSFNYTGITVSEIYEPKAAAYDISKNAITVPNNGILINNTYGTGVGTNTIYLGYGTVCTEPSGNGIQINGSIDGEITCSNLIESSPSLSSNYYTAMEESQSPSTLMSQNNTENTYQHIQFDGGSSANSNAYLNGLHTGYTGIFTTGYALYYAGIGESVKEAYNGFSGTFTCQFHAPSQVSYYCGVDCPSTCLTSLFQLQPGAAWLYYPLCIVEDTDCATSLKISKLNSIIVDGDSLMSLFVDSVTAAPNKVIPDSTVIAYMENVAQNHDTFPDLQDTGMAQAKEGVLRVLWDNQSLLSYSILYHFNDSMRSAPMGEIMAIDTDIWSADSIAGYTALLTSLNAITPVNNLEVNLQTAAWGYLTYLINDTLTPAQVSIVRTLADKCPDWDGDAVYQARALLSIYDSAGTVYSDSCSLSGHRPEKGNNLKSYRTIIGSLFNLYPNPSNGGFTLAYQLQPGQTGEFIMYDMLGKKIASYPLNPNEEKMSINEASLDNGVYLYSIIVNNSIVKQDKLVIIK